MDSNYKISKQNKLKTERVFKSTYPKIYRYATALSRNEEIAKDITQEAFVIFLQKAESIKEPEPWLFNTVKYLYINRVRKSSRHSEILKTNIKSFNTVSEAGNGDDARTLIEILDSVLTPSEKMLLLFKYYDNLSVREIAKQTGKSAGTIQTGLTQINKKLRHHLKKLNIDFEDFFN